MQHNNKVVSIPAVVVVETVVILTIAAKDKRHSARLRHKMRALSRKLAVTLSSESSGVITVRSALLLKVLRILAISLGFMERLYKFHKLFNVING